MTDGSDHPNARRIRDLYACIDAHDPGRAAQYYAADASFRDIAFRWSDRAGIALMWRYICSPIIDSAIETRVDSALADDRTGVARIVASYYMEAPFFGRRRIENHILSTFEFRDGLIVAQSDSCDAANWARQCFGDGAFAKVVAGSATLRRALALYKIGVFLAKEWLARRR